MDSNALLTGVLEEENGGIGREVTFEAMITWNLPELKKVIVSSSKTIKGLNNLHIN